MLVFLCPIGKLELQIPWKKLTKDPLVVTVDDVYVVLEPDLDTHYDPQKELKRERTAKEKKIKDYEEAAKKRKQKESECLSFDICDLKYIREGGGRRKTGRGGGRERESV